MVFSADPEDEGEAAGWAARGGGAAYFKALPRDPKVDILRRNDGGHRRENRRTPHRLTLPRSGNEGPSFRVVQRRTAPGADMEGPRPAGAEAGGV